MAAPEAGSGSGSGSAIPRAAPVFGRGLRSTNWLSHAMRAPRTRRARPQRVCDAASLARVSESDYRGVARVDRPLFGRKIIPGLGQYSYTDGKLSAPRSTSANNIVLAPGNFLREQHAQSVRNPNTVLQLAAAAAIIQPAGRPRHGEFPSRVNSDNYDQGAVYSWNPSIRARSIGSVRACGGSLAPQARVCRPS